MSQFDPMQTCRARMMMFLAERRDRWHWIFEVVRKAEMTVERRAIYLITATTISFRLRKGKVQGGL
jgi:hypothetical protein